MPKAFRIKFYNPNVQKDLLAWPAGIAASFAAISLRIGINPASLARIESSVGSRKHSPSVETLRKYARACGMQLTISLR